MGWLGIGAYVVAYDAIALRKGQPTLSASFRSAPRWVTAPIAALTLAHLYGLLPYKCDPLHLLANACSPRRR